MGSCCSCLEQDEGLFVDYPTKKEVHNGPGCFCFICGTPTKSKKPVLNQNQYLVVTHQTPLPNGDVFEIIEGPRMYEFTDAWATVSKVQNKINIPIGSYIIVENTRTSEKRIVTGATNFVAHPLEKCSEVLKGHNLNEVQYIVVQDTLTGKRKIERGPKLYIPAITEICSDMQPMITLNNNEYMYCSHAETGLMTVIEGAATFAPSAAYDKFSEIKKKIVLTNTQFVKIVDKNTGRIRVVNGPATVVLQQFEEKKGEVSNAVEVNDINSVLIFNTNDGSYELITQQGMFFPSPTQEIKEIREKVRLEINEIMVLIDKDGNYILKKGNDDTRSFFLPCYCKILEQSWSVDIEKRRIETKKVQRFDIRPQYLDYEFVVRTHDQYEVILSLNLYWQIVDTLKMICISKDVPQDICNHASCQILAAISIIEMKEFMESFNDIIQKAVKKDDEFYTQRGVVLHSVKITGRKCKDPQTEINFQEIIKTKTDRIKNLEKQASTNEVHLAEIEGQIKAEQLIGERVKVQRSYQKNEAEQMGEAEAAKIAHYFKSLPAELTTDQKLNIYLDSQNSTRVGSIARSGASIYMTKKDLDVQIVNMDYSKKKTHNDDADSDNDKKHKKNKERLPIPPNMMPKV